MLKPRALQLRGGPFANAEASGSSLHLSLMGGVGARLQQDPDDGDVAILGSDVDWGRPVVVHLVDVGMVLNQQFGDLHKPLLRRHATRVCFRRV